MNTSPWSSERWRSVVSQLRGGKKVQGHRYLHRNDVTDELLVWLEVAALIAGVSAEDFELIKLHGHQPKITLLNYPRLGFEAFPRLARSWLIDLEQRC